MSKAGQHLEAIIKDMVRQVLQSPDENIKEALASGLGIIGIINMRVNEKTELLMDQIRAYREENLALRDLVDEERKRSQIILEEAKKIITELKNTMLEENEKLKKFLYEKQQEQDKFRNIIVTIEDDDQDIFCAHAATCPFVVEPIKSGGKCIRENCVSRGEKL